MTKANFFLIGFFVVSFGELLSILLAWPIHYIFKPSILLMLIGFYLSTANPRNSTLLKALLFCWVGDFMIMFASRDEIYFILGLIAFLIGHLFYIFTFKQLVWQQPSTLLPTQRARYLFPIVLTGTGLITILYPGLGSLRIPVIIYAVVLMIMVSFALLRMSRTTSASFLWAFIGAVLFMVSDSLLAINKFYTSFEMAHLYIMITYIAAQLLIVKGMATHPINS